MKIFVLSMALLLLAGCAGNPYSYPRSRPAPPPAPTVEAPPPAPTSEPVIVQPHPEEDEQVIVPGTSSETNPVVGRLITQGWDLFYAREYDRAIATGERAMRLERTNAEIYYLLARCHQQQSRIDQARQLTRQGLVYSPKGSLMERQLNTLLASLE